MQELITKFDELLKSRKKESDFKLFDNAFRELLQWCAEKYPDTAKRIVDKLDAMGWKQYLTKEEADKITSAMNPAPKWNSSQLAQHLDNLSLEKEEENIFNWWAMFTTISMIYSDHANTLARCAFGRNRAEEVDDREMLPFIHSLALDKLKDKDGKFEIRKYFGY